MLNAIRNWRMKAEQRRHARERDNEAVRSALRQLNAENPTGPDGKDFQFWIKQDELSSFGDGPKWAENLLSERVAAIKRGAVQTDQPSRTRNQP